MTKRTWCKVHSRWDMCDHPGCHMDQCELRGSKAEALAQLEKRIEDALNVLDWAGENSKEFLINKCLAVGGILRGVMTPADLRKEGFDIKKFKTERQMFEEAVDLFSKRHAAVLEELETMRKRRSDAVEIIEEKRARIQELEKNWRSAKKLPGLCDEV